MECYSMKNQFITTQKQVQFIKQAFSEQLERKLDLIEVQAPLLNRLGNGVQDNLSGFERSVKVKIKSLPEDVFEVMHSLAKLKRHTLARFGFHAGEGIYTHMKSLRPDEEFLGPLHSVQVDQWDWEKVMHPHEYHLGFLKSTVLALYEAIKNVEEQLEKQFNIAPILPKQLHFIHSEELLKKYPNLPPKERERAITKSLGAVFLIGIGAKLSNNEVHDLRASDYDDWSTPNENQYLGLNGDIIVWNPVINDSFELSSMGIRVNSDALKRQLAITKNEDRLNLPWHQQLLRGQLPQTIGGGIGQSRLVMLLLGREHIGQVQSSVWPADEQAKATL